MPINFDTCLKDNHQIEQRKHREYKNCIFCCCCCAQKGFKQACDVIPFIYLHSFLLFHHNISVCTLSFISLLKIRRYWLELNGNKRISLEMEAAGLELMLICKILFSVDYINWLWHWYVYLVLLTAEILSAGYLYQRLIILWQQGTALSLSLSIQLEHDSRW